MSTMRCVVTGASGFLGGALVTRLVEQGSTVLAVVRPESKLWRLLPVIESIELAYASLQDISSIESQIVDFKPGIVYHAAWSGGDSSKYLNSLDQMTNVPGSLELVNLAGRAQAKAFIFFGSGVEYGKFRVPVSENDVAEPNNLYGATKLTTGIATKSLCDMWKMRYCCVRPFWTYGPKDSDLRMIPSLTEQLLDRKRPSLTKGDQLWDYLYIDDATDALVSLGQTPDAKGIFNLASGQAVPLRSVIEGIRDLIDPTLELGLGDVPYGPHQVMHLQASIDRLKEVTGWQPKVGLVDGLKATVAWHQTQRPQGWPRIKDIPKDT